MAAAGIWYNSATLTVDYSGLSEELNTEESEFGPYDLSYFYPIFYLLWSICITFYILLAITGIQLIRLKTGWVFALLGVVLVEVVYFLLLGRSWLMPEYGPSIGAATGISSGGLVFQWVSLFPIWAPLAAFWARNRINKG